MVVIKIYGSYKRSAPHPRLNKPSGLSAIPFINLNIIQQSHIPLTELRGGTELFLFPIRVISAEGSMPWHGDLRAETGDFLTGEQENRRC